MVPADSIRTKLKSSKRNEIVRLVLWGIWYAAGLIILILLAAKVVMLIEKPPLSQPDVQQRMDSLDSETPASYGSAHEEKQEDDEVKDIIKQIYNRKGYSNPSRTPEDDDDDDDDEVVVTRRPRTRRPLKLIGKDFDTSKSFIIKHPNGTLTYVFPKTIVSSTTMPTISPTTQPPVSIGEKLDTDNPFLQDRSMYPDDLINDIITLHKATFEGVFGDDFVIPDGDALNTRSEAFNEPFFCESDQTLFHPVEGVSRSNSKVWIVNTKDYKQGVRIETCRNVGMPCRFCDSDTVCKQIYHYRTLVAVDKITNKPYKEQIKLPSCCKCAKKL